MRSMFLQMTISVSMFIVTCVSFSRLRSCSTVPKHSPWEKLSTYQTTKRRCFSWIFMSEISNSKLSLKIGEHDPFWIFDFISWFPAFKQGRILAVTYTVGSSFLASGSSSAFKSFTRMLDLKKFTKTFKLVYFRHKEFFTTREGQNTLIKHFDNFFADL